MEQLKELISALIFVVSVVLLFAVLAGELWTLSLLSVAGFFLAYYLWPSKKRGKREAGSAVLDYIELIIEFPVELIYWLLRIIGKLIFSVFD